MKCLNCKKELEKGQKKYCSNQCQADKRYKDYIQQWKKGEESGNTKWQLSHYVKKYLFIKNNFKCQKCGWSELNEFTRKYPLEIHHIDGDYTNCKEDNLELLCPNCHSQTPTFRGRKRT